MSVNGSTTITPRLGTIVRYTLGDNDVQRIIDNRRNAGYASARGNDPREGDTYPAIIVRDWLSTELVAKAREGKVTTAEGVTISAEQVITEGSANLQVFLDGNDTYWVTSVSKFDPKRHGRFKTPADGVDIDEPDKEQFWEADPRGHWTDEPVSW